MSRLLSLRYLVGFSSFASYVLFQVIVNEDPFDTRQERTDELLGKGAKCSTNNKECYSFKLEDFVVHLSDALVQNRKQRKPSFLETHTAKATRERGERYLHFERLDSPTSLSSVSRQKKYETVRNFCSSRRRLRDHQQRATAQPLGPSLHFW